MITINFNVHRKNAQYGKINELLAGNSQELSNKYNRSKHIIAYVYGVYFLLVRRIFFWA